MRRTGNSFDSILLYDLIHFALLFFAYRKQTPTIKMFGLMKTQIIFTQQIVELVSQQKKLDFTY